MQELGKFLQLTNCTTEEKPSIQVNDGRGTVLLFGPWRGLYSAGGHGLGWLAVARGWACITRMQEINCKRDLTLALSARYQEPIDTREAMLALLESGKLPFQQVRAHGWLDLAHFITSLHISPLSLSPSLKHLRSPTLTDPAA